MKDRVNNWRREIGLAAVLGLLIVPISESTAVTADQQTSAQQQASPPYAALADLINFSPAIAVIVIKKTKTVSPELAPGLAPGKQRILVTAQTQSLIRGNDVLAREINFLIDIPLQENARPPKWKGRVLMIFGRIEDRVDFFQLRSSEAAIPWTPENEALVRKVVADLSAADAPPAIEGIDSVFHVQGAVAGEGETQIFLNTADGSPISLSVVRRPDEQPQFGVSLGEIVDDAAAMPAANTPLWYRMACFLPDKLPQKVLAGQATADAAAASRDYKAFLDALAPCDRDLPPLQ